MSLLLRWIRRTSPFVAASLFGHILLLVVVITTPMGDGCQMMPKEIGIALPVHTGKAIDVQMIEPTVLNPYAPRPTVEEQQAEVEKKQEEARKEEEDPDLGGQVVDIAKPDIEIRPDEARFLSEYDSKVAKETKAKPGEGKAGAQRPRKQVAMAQPPSAPRPPKEAVQPVAPKAPTLGGGGAGGHGTLAMRQPSATKPSETQGKEDGLEKTDAVGSEVAKGGATTPTPEVASGAAGETRPGQQGVEGQLPDPGAPAVLPRMSDLRPSDELVSHAVGAGSNDYLKDIDDGEDTLLNTKRWKYSGFFTRVKKDVSQSWRPDNAYRLRDPTGQIYGHKNRFTVLKVSLKPDGSLSDVMVEKPCGVDFLDDEAVTAFREAQPFPNPPPGLVDPGSRLITFRFGFYFEITGAPTFRVIRQ